MPRFTFVLWVFLLSVLALPVWAEPAAPASAPIAAPSDPYTVSGVTVDIKADASKARDMSFTEGGRKAFDMLATKLAGAGKVNAAKIDDAQIGKLIKSFEVEKEKASSGRYIATLTFHFRPSAAQSFFASRNISINEDPTAPTNEAKTEDAKPDDKVPANLTAIRPVDLVLVLPVMQVNDRTVMWEEQTPWQRAWANYVSDAAAPDLVVGEGSMEDVRIINTADTVNGIRPALLRIMKKYNAKSVIVAMLQSPSMVPPSSSDLMINATRYDFAGVPVGNFSVPLHPDRGARIMEWLQGGAAGVINSMRNMPAVAGGTPTMDTSSSVSGQLPGGQVQPATTNLTISVPFAREEDWGNASSTVEAINGVTRFESASINRERAVVKLSFNGMRPQLEQALMDHGYQLVQPNAPGAMPILLPMGQVLNAAPPAVTPPGMRTIPAPITIQEPPQVPVIIQGPDTDQPEDNGQ